jgi:hypothetical protein
MTGLSPINRVLAAIRGVLAVCSLAPDRAVAQQQPEKLDIIDAQHFATAAYGWAPKYIKYDHKEGVFLMFALLDVKNAATRVGWLAVNAWTGDVWDTWRCARLWDPALREWQAGIHRRFRRDARRYAELRALRPTCN